MRTIWAVHVFNCDFLTYKILYVKQPLIATYCISKKVMKKGLFKYFFPLTDRDTSIQERESNNTDIQEREVLKVYR
jgi:hypothetical protein